MDLDKLYLDLNSPAGLAGEKQLYRSAKALDGSVTLKRVREFLKKKDSYTLHRVTRKKFRRRQIIVSGPGTILSMDLGDMSKLSKFNKGYKYMLVVIDSFSRYLNVELIKKKNADHVLGALKRILRNIEFKNVSRIQADKGAEFINKKMTTYLNGKGIVLYSVSSFEIKAAIAERVIQTIKRKVYKYLTEYNTRRYEDVLNSIVNAYNHTHHRTLKSTPYKIHSLKDPEKIRSQFNMMYKRSIPPRSSISLPLAVGDIVRLAYKKQIFRRGFQIQNTEELFKIRDIDIRQHPPVYYLEDLDQEDITGVFYASELTSAIIPNYFPVEILRKKKEKGKIYYYISWRGYPKKFEQWILAKDLKKI